MSRDSLLSSRSSGALVLDVALALRVAGNREFGLATAGRRLVRGVALGVEAGLRRVGRDADDAGHGIRGLEEGRLVVRGSSWRVRATAAATVTSIATVALTANTRGTTTEARHLAPELVGLNLRTLS